MTREQVEQEMAQYRTIFTVVRLLTQSRWAAAVTSTNTASAIPIGRRTPPARTAFPGRFWRITASAEKLEYMGREVFQVTAVYREVDGRPCVMELIQQLDSETLIDPENGDRLIDSIVLPRQALPRFPDRTATAAAILRTC